MTFLSVHQGCQLLLLFFAIDLTFQILIKGRNSLDLNFPLTFSYNLVISCSTRLNLRSHSGH